MPALPGSAYLYQGEELGLHEVGDIPDESRQDPVFLRSGGTDKGRDGCRVPLPWAVAGPSFGFGAGTAHLPQPAWFGSCSVEAEESDPNSTLEFYRQALSWRRKLLTAGGPEWSPSAGLEWSQAAGQDVLQFARPEGWQSVTNFGSGPMALPKGTVVIASSPLDGGRLPPDTTAWLIDPDSSPAG
jgi:alpha-glucosidase